MEFSEFERHLEHLFISEEVLTYFGSKLSSLDYKGIRNEIAIQDNLLDFRNDEIPEAIIEYATSCLERSTLWRPKIRYFLFLIKNLKNRSKYGCAKSFADFFIDSSEKIIKNETDIGLITECFNTLLEVCVRMKIRTDEIWDITLEHLQRHPHSIYKYVPKMMALIGANEERAEIIRSILMEQLLLDAKMGNYHPIERLLDEIIHYKKFLVEITVVKRKLAEAYMKQIENDSSAIRGITFSQKAASIYTELKDSEEETKCLSILSKHIESDSPEWHEAEHELPVEYNDGLIKKARVIQEYFSDANIPVQNRITTLAEFLTISDESNGRTEVIYRPFADKSMIEGAAEELNQSVFLQFVSVLTLDQNKVIANGNNSSLKARELSYTMHKELNTLPAINALENSQDYSIDELKNFLKNCPLVTEDEMVFMNEALDEYSKGRWIPFICVITPSFESILRELYAKFEDTDIQAKNKDSLVHTTVNLTTVLNNQKVRQVLTDDLANYLEYLLNSETSSENIRNNVAHRLTKSNFYSQDRSRVLIHALIQVTARIKSEFKEK